MKITMTAQPKSRLVAMRLTSLTLRSMENWRRLTGSYDEAMILVALAAVSTDKLLRAEMTPFQLDLRNKLGRDTYAKCTINSLAVATGLNRETARRRVNTLIGRSYLERDEEGFVVFCSGFQQKKLVQDVINSQLEAFRRTAELLVRDGVLEVVGP